MRAFYDFHSLVTMRVLDETGRGKSNRVDPFPSFQVNALPDRPDISLELGSFEPKKGGCCLVDHTYHVRKNYLFCAESWQKFRWNVEIEGFEQGPTTIRLDLRGGGLRGVLFPGLYSRMLLTRQVLAQKLYKRGYVLAHAAGAAREGRAVVLFGRGGTYKTSIIMSLLRSCASWRSLGDDGVVLSGKKVLSFPTYPGLFAYRMRHKSDENLNVFDRVHYMLRPISVNAAGEYFTEKAETVALVEMRVGGVKHIIIEEVSLERNLIAMQAGIHLEAHNSVNMGFNDIYPRYVEAYSYVFPQNSLVTAWEPGAEFAGLLAYRVTLPFSPTQNDLQTVVKLLSEVVC